MRDFGKAILALAIIAALFTVFWLFMLPLFAGGRVVDRVAQKYDAETSKQAYDTSRQYQQGTQLDLSRYCRQYADAQGAAKSAVADLIRDTAATYSGPLTPNNQACLSEVGQ